MANSLLAKLEAKCKTFSIFSFLQLSNNDVDENSDVDTVVGMLNTADQDNGQTYTYSMLDGAGGRFKIQGNLVKVSDRQWVDDYV